MLPTSGGSFSANYIKTKSREELERETKEAQLLLKKAGSNDQHPGGNHMPTSRVFETGVLMPQQFEVTDHPGGGPLAGNSHHTWSPSAGVGGGSVDMPPETPREFLTDHHTYFPYPWFDGRLARRSLVATSRLYGHKNQSNTFDHVNIYIPGSVYKSLGGTLDQSQTNGSVGPDPDSVDRFKRKSRRGQGR